MNTFNCPRLVEEGLLRDVRGFRIPERTQAFLSNSGPIRRHFAFKRHLQRNSIYRKQLGKRFAAWRRFTESAQTVLSEQSGVIFAFAPPAIRRDRAPQTCGQLFRYAPRHG
jgi:hypothetical protein